MKKVVALMAFLILATFISGCANVTKTIAETDPSPVPALSPAANMSTQLQQVPDNTSTPTPEPSSSPAPTEVPASATPVIMSDTATPTASPTPAPTSTPTPVPGGAISGDLRTQYIEPPVGYTLKVIDARDSFSPSILDSLTVHYQTTTDSNGCFQLSNVAVGSYMIVVLKAGTVVGVSYNFDVAEGQTTSVNIAVSIPDDPSLTPRVTPVPWGFVRAIVRLQNGSPAAGTAVRIVTTDHSSVVQEAITLSDGSYTFAHLPLDTYQVYAEINDSLFKYSDSFTIENHVIRDVNLVL